ncbi:MAG: NAD(P)/FAD-dependent oxidoreductase [Pseudomonadota bacterium]
MNTDISEAGSYDVIVVGAGASGVGVAITLKDAGVQNFVVLEREQVGASFAKWPRETRFITPSFPSNSIGMLDLNSIALGVSPGASMEVEHPTGQEYAGHLRAVARYFAIPVRENIDVLKVSHDGHEFTLETTDSLLRSKHLIWAAGEFQYPHQTGFAGSQLCRHTATIDSYEELEGNDFAIIGGFESGIDAAYHLALNDKRVRIFDRGSPWDNPSSDPSISISPFTRERMQEDWFFEQVELVANTPISSVDYKEGRYVITSLDGDLFTSDTQPLWAGGFKGSHHLISDLFEQRYDHFPVVNDQDESTITPGLFLCGPMLRHDDHIFCFIYKYRQRFAVVAKAIATSLGLPAEGLEMYRTWGMYLDDLSCCGEECVC